MFCLKKSTKNQLLANFLNKQFKIYLILTKKTVFMIKNREKLIERAIIA